MRTAAILLAGGFGTRMESASPKQYLTLKGKPIAQHSFDLFREMDEIYEIVVVCQKEYEPLFPGATFARPGKRRQDSMANGFYALKSSPLFCLIHDSARPLVSKEDVRNCIKACSETGAAALGVPIRFTVKEINESQHVVSTPNRSQLWEIQTPQVIREPLLRKGLKFIEEREVAVTDDVSIVEALNLPVKIVEGSRMNLKVTVPEDLIIAETFLNEIHS
ncbi:MAG: 2-C-methyl-D-erythritol 4-phosphate cytidylyltransferase [Waddliaceae bacterium]